MLLTPERIQQTIKGAHQKRPRVILPVKEIYEALAQDQHQQDGDWLEKYVHSLTRSPALLIITTKHWQALKKLKALGG